MPGVKTDKYILLPLATKTEFSALCSRRPAQIDPDISDFVVAFCTRLCLRMGIQ